MAGSPGVRSSDIVYNGKMPVVHNSAVLTGVTTASAISAEFIAQFPFKIKEANFLISDGLASTGFVPKLLRNGTAIATLTANGLATGLHSMAFTTTFEAAGRQINRGDRLKWSIPNLASSAGFGGFIGAPE